LTGFAVLTGIWDFQILEFFNRITSKRPFAAGCIKVRYGDIRQVAALKGQTLAIDI
jgi:hypothetical protein